MSTKISAREVIVRLFGKFGAEIPDTIRANNEWFEVKARDDKYGKKSMSARINPRTGTLTAKSFKSGDVHRHRLSRSEKAAILSCHSDAFSFKAKTVRDKDRQQGMVAHLAKRTLKRMSLAIGRDHPYLERKGVEAHGIYVDEEVLYIPMYFDGEVVSYQTINAAGEKRFRKSGRTKGCYFQIGPTTPSMYIAEGYATGATLYETTGWGVIICFTANNLLSVAESMIQLLPEVSFIIAADNDHLTKGNPGLTKAREASKITGIPYTYPIFPEGYPGTDFNDLALMEVGGISCE